MNIYPFIQAHQLQNFVYVIMFLAMFFDAAITIFAAVFLMTAGSVAVVPTLLILISGIYGEQLFYYWLGHTLSRNDLLMVWAGKIAAPFDKHLQERTFRTLLVSKFVYGMHRAMLIRSGMVKIPAARFVKFSAVIGIIWLAAVGGLALAFSASYQEFKRYFAFAEVIFLALIVIGFILQRMFAGKLKKEL